MSFPALLFHILQIWALSSFLNRCYGKFCRHFTLLPTSILLKPDFYQSNFIRVPIFWSKNNKSIVIFSKGFRQNKTIMISGQDVVPVHHTISFRILSLIVVYRSQQKKENIKKYIIKPSITIVKQCLRTQLSCVKQITGINLL